MTVREMIFGALYGKDCRDAQTAGAVTDAILDRVGEEIIVRLRAEVSFVPDDTRDVLREIASQCHNLPRSGTADTIEALCREYTK